MARQALSVNAIFVGLCALVPIPFLDDLLRKLMMRGAYQAIAEHQAKTLPEPALNELTRGDRIRVLGCLVGVVWYGIKKLSKKILYFLAVKDALDWAAEAAVRGEMVRLALARGALPDQHERVRAAMDKAWKEHGGSPVTRTLMRYRSDDLDWSSQDGAVVPVVAGLARRGAGARVINAFLAELDGSDGVAAAGDVDGGEASAVDQE